MRLMSFALTTEQIRNQTKTVTRRLGWQFLKPGDLLQPVAKAQGLKKGECVERIGGPIRVVSVVRQQLLDIGVVYNYYEDETAREGFPGLSAMEFEAMFMAANHCHSTDYVTRIEFEYTEPALAPEGEEQSV